MIRDRGPTSAVRALRLGLLLLATAVRPAVAGISFDAPFLNFDVSRSPSAVAVADLNGDGHPDLVASDFNSDAVSVLLGIGDGTFGARTDFATGKNPQCVAIGDLNGDLVPDVVVTNYTANTISVLLGNGNGTFAAKSDFAAGAGPQFLVLQDINGDGKPDVVVADRSSNTVAVLLGNGDGTFQPRAEFATGNTPLWIAVGRLNADAFPDLVVANNGLNTVSVLLGNGDGTFQPKTDINAGTSPRAVVLSDLDADGRLDLAVANTSPSTVSVLLGNGDGSFGARTAYGVGANPQALAVADLNHDGRPDLVTANYSGNNASVLLGNGDGSFGAKTDYRSGNQPNFVAIGDLDGDGNQDLAMSCWFTWDFADVSVLHGNGDGSFGTQRHFATDTDPWAVVTGDLDRDGRADLVTANFTPSTISVLLGNGDGTFATKTDYPVGLNPVSVMLGDLNLDNRLDAVVANRAANTVSVLIGNGDGTFGPRTDYPVGVNPLAAAMGDLNEDGLPDLAVVNRGSSTVSILLGNGDGTFRPKSDVASGADPFSVAIGDFDGDRTADLAVANSSSNTVSILIGNGDGTFKPRVDYATGGQPYSVAVGDLNGDGRQDLAVADRGTNTVSVLLGIGDGTFAPRTDYQAGLFPQSVVMKDVDGDGQQDLVVANEQSNSVSVFVGHGDGTFAPTVEYGAGTFARSLAVVDLDRDRGEDIVVSCYSLATVTVLRNNSPPPVANPVSLGPAAPISPLDPCATMPLVIRRTDARPLLGFSAKLRLSANLRLCGARATEGGYLGAVNPAVQLSIVDNGDGVYTLDCVTLGSPCGATAPHGTLLDLHLASDAPAGTGTVTLLAMTLRDCDNLTVPANLGPAQSVPIDNSPTANPVTLGVPGDCISTADTCMALPVQISRTSAEGLLGFSARLWLSPELRLCGARATEGGYLSATNPSTQTLVTDHGDGTCTVDCVILGSPCGAAGPGGTLFDLHLASSDASGTGRVVLTGITLRDCQNQAVSAAVGPPVSVTIDAVRPAAPAALTATQQRTGNDADGTTRIALGWTAVPGTVSMELYRAGFGGYPQYDGAGGSVPAAPTWPPGPRWSQVASVPGGTSYVDAPGQRDFYYYAAFAKDACGNRSATAAVTGGTLDYHLGDVHDGLTSCQGNNRVWTEDLSFLGASYGASLGPADPRGCLDVGPTSDSSVRGRPLTDGRLDFEDLMMFSINFRQVSAPLLAAEPVPAEAVPAAAVDLPEVALDAPARVASGEVFPVRVRLRSTTGLQGVSTQLAWDGAVAEPVAVDAGPLVTAAGGVVLSSRPGNVDAVLLGVQPQGLAGDGVLATVSFRAKRAGDPAAAIAAVDARDAVNRKVPVAGARPPAPVVTALAPAAPNPFAGRTAISFGLARPGPAQLAIYSVDGRRVRTLAGGPREAGTYRLEWDGLDDSGRAVSPGVFFARLVTADGRFTRTLVMMK